MTSSTILMTSLVLALFPPQDPLLMHSKKLLQKLRLDISTKKLVQPATKVVCLGVKVDTGNFTVAILTEKVLEILQKYHHWTGRTYSTKKELQNVSDLQRNHFGTENIQLDITPENHDTPLFQIKNDTAQWIPLTDTKVRQTFSQILQRLGLNNSSMSLHTFRCNISF